MSTRIVTRADLFFFVWRELLKNPKEQLVAIRLRYDSLYAWVEENTDLVERLPIVFPLESVEWALGKSWRWPSQIQVPYDIYLSILTHKIEWVLEKNSYPLVY